MVEVRRFNTLDDLVRSLRSELGNTQRLLLMLMGEWGSVVGSEGGVELAGEASEVFRFISDSTEAFNLRITYKPGSASRARLVSEAVGYLQRRAALLRIVIEGLEGVGTGRDRPVLALLVDSIPVVVILNA